MGHFSALRLFAAAEDHFSHPRSAGDAAASSCSTHRKDDGARRDTDLAPAWLELAVDTFQRRKSAPSFRVRGRRGETRSSQPSCDTNSAATRCSCGGGPRCCERPATRLAQVGRGAFTSVRLTRPLNGGAITAIHAGKERVQQDRESFSGSRKFCNYYKACFYHRGALTKESHCPSPNAAKSASKDQFCLCVRLFAKYLERL